MQIIRKGNLNILIAEDGYELINKKTSMRSSKIYLANSDSIDNYIEVMKSDYVSGLSELKEQKDIEIILLIETIDSLIALLEPILYAIPLSINEDRVNPLDKIVDFYIEIINRGLKEIDEVPSILKDLVIDNINKK